MDDHVRVRRAVAAEHAIREQPRAGGNADDLAGMTAAVGGRDARDVRAVSSIGRAGPEYLVVVGIVGIARNGIAVRVRNGLKGVAGGSRVVAVAHEVEAAADLARRPEAATELGERVVQAAVHDRDRHARAVDAELVLRDVGSGQSDRAAQVDLRAPAFRAPVGQGHGVDRIDTLDAGDRPEGGDLRRGDGHGDAVPERVVRVPFGEPDPVRGRGCLECVSLGFELRLAPSLDRGRAGKLHEPAGGSLVRGAAERL